MEFDRRDIPMNKLVVTGLESKFSVFDMRTQHPTKGFASLTESVSSFCLKLLPQKPAIVGTATTLSVHNVASL